MEGDLLYSKSTDLNVSRIFKKIFTAKSRLMVDQATGLHSLAKLTSKINHHIDQIIWGNCKKYISFSLSDATEATLRRLEAK